MVESSESSPKSFFLESCSINPNVTPFTPCDASWILYNSRWQFESETKVKSWQLEVQEMKVKCVFFTLLRQHDGHKCRIPGVLGGNMSGKDGDLWKLGRRIHIPLEPFTRMVPLSGGEDCCIARGPKRIHQNENGTWNRWN